MTEDANIKAHLIELNNTVTTMVSYNNEQLQSDKAVISTFCVWCLCLCRMSVSLSYPTTSTRSCQQSAETTE